MARDAVRALVGACAPLASPLLRGPDEAAAVALLHAAGAAIAHVFEAVLRRGHLWQASLLVSMGQQVAADSKLNHLLKNKSAEARAEIDSLRRATGTGLPPSMVARRHRRRIRAHVPHLALERARIQPYSAVFRCSHCIRTPRIHALLCTRCTIPYSRPHVGVFTTRRCSGSHRSICC